MPNAGTSSSWHVIIVEDNAGYVKDIREYFDDSTFGSRKLRFSEFVDLNSALESIHDIRADLVILDVFQGDPKREGVPLGAEILQKISDNGFAGVVFYTAFPEKVEDSASRFVRVVSKTDGLPKLEEEIKFLFEKKVPQITRHIFDWLDKALSSYMWGFAQEHWEELTAYSNKSEFMRIVVNRLAAAAAAPDIVQAAELYIIPPIYNYPSMGDIRKRVIDDSTDFLVLVWPSCDLVEDETSTPPRVRKTENVLVLRASLMEESPEYSRWNDDANTGKKRLLQMMKNHRRYSKDEEIGTSERYHFLPPAWEIPGLVLDFQNFEYIGLDVFKSLTCVATLASPFAEDLSKRFHDYLGRLGTPDLDTKTVLEIIERKLNPNSE